MIRAALALSLALAGPVWAERTAIGPDCNAVWTSLATSFPLRGAVAPPDGEWCVFADVVLDMPGTYVPDWHAEKLRLRGAALTWAVDRSLPPDRLELAVEGLRLVVQTGDPQMDYLFAAQARPNRIGVQAALAWDGAARTLTVERLEIDFPGENLVSLTALVNGVDLSSEGAMQMSATGFAVTEADLMIQTHGLFEWYVLMAFGPMVLPREGDMAAAMARVRADLVTGIAALPDATFPQASKAALAALAGELPNPSGILTLSLRSAAGVGPARLMGYAMTGVPHTMAEAGPLFDGVTVNIGWSHEDAR
jgi:hypothetical protein